MAQWYSLYIRKSGGLSRRRPFWMTMRTARGSATNVAGVPGGGCASDAQTQAQTAVGEERRAVDRREEAIASKANGEARRTCG